MRKKIIGFLIIPILLIAVVGCDLDALSGLMGKMGTNVLTSTGVVTVDDTQTKNVANKVSNVVDGGGEVDKAKLKEIKDDLKDILESPKKSEDLKEKLKEDVKDQDAADNAKGKLQDKLEDLFGGGVGDDDSELDIEIKTEADLLVAVLFIDLLDNIEDALDGKDFEEADLDDETLLDLVADAFLIIEVVNSVSSTGDVDIDEILSEFLAGFGDFRGISRSSSRDGGDDIDPVDVVVPILKSIIVAMDTNGNKIISEGELSAMVSNYSLIRNSYENMARALEFRKNTNKKPIKVSDPINYLISIVMTTGTSELSKYDNSANGGGKGFIGLLNDVYKFILAYEKNDKVEFEDFVSTNEIEVGLFDKVFGDDEPVEDKVALRIRKTLETLIDASDLSGFDLFDL